MKLTVTIDLDDIYQDENSLSEEIIRSIKREVVNEIKTSVKDQVNEKITSVVTLMAKEHLSETILNHFKETVQKGVIIPGSRTIYESDGKAKNVSSCTLDEYLTSLFMDRQSYSTLNSEIEKRAKSISDELKSRYDLIFASQIVSKMSDNGLLKDELISKLLTK